MKALIINCSPVKTGATAEIVRIVEGELSAHYDTRCICIDDYRFDFCRGCRTCHRTARCITDVIVSVSPSYWADIPGQFKAFIDRCTPWCDTHEPHASIREGKRGFAIALRTGPGMHECDRIIQSIEHFYGHLHIACVGHLGLTSIEYRENVEERRTEITDFCKTIEGK